VMSGGRVLDSRSKRRSCKCRFTLRGNPTTCNAETTYLQKFEDRATQAINDSVRFVQQWSDIVLRGKEYIARFANLLLESEQLEQGTLMNATTATMASESVFNASLPELSRGKRSGVLAGIQQDLMSLHDRLTSVQHRRLSSLQRLAEDVDICHALELQRCTKNGVIRATDPIFKTLGIIDIHRMLAQIGSMYSQELLLK